MYYWKQGNGCGDEDAMVKDEGKGGGGREAYQFVFCVSIEMAISAPSFSIQFVSFPSRTHSLPREKTLELNIKHTKVIDIEHSRNSTARPPMTNLRLDWTARQTFGHCRVGLLEVEVIGVYRDGLRLSGCHGRIFVSMC